MSIKPEDLRVGQIVKTSHPPLAALQIDSMGHSVVVGYRLSNDLHWVLRDWGLYVVKISDIVEIVKQPEELYQQTKERLEGSK